MGLDTKAISDVILVRRSIRAYQKKELPKGFEEEVLNMAVWAPNAGNVQPWKFYVIHNADVKKSLAEAAYGQAFVYEAPLVIGVCVRIDLAEKSYGNRGVNLYCIQDTAAAIQNMLLYAASKGIGTCWVGAFDENKVAKILKCTTKERPVAIIPFGYPAESPSPPRRKSVKDITQIIN